MKEQHELPGELSPLEDMEEISGEIFYRGVVWRFNKTWWGWFTQGVAGGTAWSIHARKDEIEKKTDRLLDEDGFTPAIGWRT